MSGKESQQAQLVMFDAFVDTQVRFNRVLRSFVADPWKQAYAEIDCRRVERKFFFFFFI